MYVANDQKDDGSQIALPLYASGYDKSWYFGSWQYGAPGDTVEIGTQVLISGSVVTSGYPVSGTIGSGVNDSGTWEVYLSVQADTTTTNRWRAKINGITSTGGSRTVKTIAAPVTFGTISASNPSSTSVDFVGEWYPNTNESYGEAHLYYKKTTDVTWSEWTLDGTHYQGATKRTVSVTVTGLTAGTSYQFKLGIWRNVSNPTGYTASEWTYSSTVTASTLAATPTITTEEASSVAHSSAQLNGTIDANLISCTVSFLWNKCARRTISYEAQPTDGENVTVGSNVYYFKDNATASGVLEYDNGTLPTAGKQVAVGLLAYTFVEEVASSGGEVAYSGQPTPTKIVTIPDGSVTPPVYTFVSGPVANPGDILIGVDEDTTFASLVSAINGVADGVDHKCFGGDGVAHTLFSATADALNNRVTLTTLEVGPIGNVTITTDDGAITPTSPTGGDWVDDEGDVLIGATPDDTLTNLTRAINNSGGTSGEGEDYIPAGGDAHPDVTAAIDTGADEITVTAIEEGAAGNSIVLTSDEVSFTTPGTLSGGADLPGTDDYEVLIGADADATMLNFQYCVNKSGGTEGINYNAVAAHPSVEATLRATHGTPPVLGILYLDVPTNLNPALTFTTDVSDFTLSTSTEDPWAQETSTTAFSTDGTTGFSEPLSSLDVVRTYYFKAKVTWVSGGGGTLYGDEKFFTTPETPGVAAVQEEHMHIYEYDGQYGVDKTVYFTLQNPSSVDSDRLVTTAPGSLFASGDVKISKDGGAFANATNSVAQVAASNPLYKLTLDAAAGEMDAEDIVVQIVDQNGPAFRDAYIHVRTAQRLSELDIDATAGPTDASAIVAIGNGTGAGIYATSAGTGADIDAILASMWLRAHLCPSQSGVPGNKIKLDSDAASVNDYYEGNTVCIISGTGVGQARAIIGYDGSGRLCTLDSAWSTAPDASSIYGILPGSQTWNNAPGDELTTMSSWVTPSYGEMLQLLYQRFAFKIEQTAAAQTWYKEGGIDEAFVRTVSDDGVTQEIEQLAEA